MNDLKTRKILTMDLERGWIRYALTSEHLDVLESGKMPVENTEEPEAVFEVIAEIAEKYRNEADGIAFSMPGLIDSVHGIAYSGGMYRWVENMEYARLIQERTGMKAMIVNDAKAVALAEAAYGSLKKVRRGVVLLLLGTGIGGAIVDDGRLVDGSHFAAGEFSFISGDYLDREDGDDMFSAALSINHLVEIVREETGIENLNIMKIMRGVSVKDEDIMRGVRIYCRRLAVFISNIQAISDVDQFSIGGNITDEAGIVDLIREAVHERFQRSRYHSLTEPVICSVSFHEDSRKYGAVHLYMKLFGEDHVDE